MAHHDTAYDNASKSARINQMGERLYTVRPRWRAHIGDQATRGEVSTIRMIRSNTMTDAELSDYKVKMTESEQRAFNKLNSSSGFYDFILQSINYTMQEKVQSFYTFGSKEALYFYGHNPVQFNLTGVVTDDLDNDQFVQFTTLFNNHLRGSRAAEDFSLVEISLPNVTIFGSIVSLTLSQQSDRDTDIGFQLAIVAKHYVFRSTDEFFMNEDGKVEDYQGANFLTSSPGFAALEERFKAYAEARARWNELGTTGSGQYNITMDGSGKPNAETVGVTTIAASGIYTEKVATPESLKDILESLDSEWSLGGLIDDGAEWMADKARYVTDIVGIVSDIADSVISYIGKIEAGIDKVLETVTGLVSTVMGVATSLETAWGSIVNFPESIAGKIGRFLEGGGMNMEGTALAGSEYISSSDAEALLKTQARTSAGAVRGTQRDPSTKSSADDFATLTF